MSDFVKIPLTAEDQDLVETATSLIVDRGEYGRHHIASALKTNSGEKIVGLHLSANIGVSSICAEAAAIAEALRRSPTTIEKIVSVRHTFLASPVTEIVQPCGRCRELILEYGSEALVIVDVAGEVICVRITDLFPLPFHRRTRPSQMA